MGDPGWLYSVVPTTQPERKMATSMPRVWTALFGEMLNQNVDVVFGRSRHPKMQEE
jgi:hypothetical protein